MRLFIVVAALLCSAPAPAADLPCPKRYFCWQVRAAVASFGEAATEAHVRACGWSDARIEEARRCLRR
jgi:hypothetical protein